MNRDRKSRRPTTERDSQPASGRKHREPVTGGRRANDRYAISDTTGTASIFHGLTTDNPPGTYTFGDGCRAIVYSDGTVIVFPHSHIGASTTTAYVAHTDDSSANAAAAATAAESHDLHPAAGMRSADTTSDLSSDT